MVQLGQPPGGDGRGVLRAALPARAARAGGAQGTAVADAAATAGVARLVYSSAAGADRGIGIPETDSKWAIEQHLAALELPVTVLRPTFLMENFDIPELKQSILGGAQFDPNLATLGAWLDREGYRADLPALRRLRPGILTLEAWLRHTSWATP